MTLTIGSLFSGIGGLELGLEATGMETVWQVEKNPYCQRILAKHWPDAVRYTDVKDVGSHNLAPVDVICGGFPCQDISYAGKGAGLAGHRSSLWFEFARIIGEMGPRYAVVENVPALFTRGLDQVLGTLADLGYDAEWQTLSAADVGAPQLRKRIFIVAFARGLEGRMAPKPDDGREGDEAARRGEGLGDTPATRRGEQPANLADATAGRCEQPEQTLAGSRHVSMVDAEGGGWGTRRGESARRPDGGCAELDHPEAIGLETRRLSEQAAEKHTSTPERDRRLGDWSDATPVRGADGTIRLIPKEAAQAGPQSPLWPVADGLPGRVARLSAIGNAVVPRVARQIGLRIQQMEAGR